MPVVYKCDGCGNVLGRTDVVLEGASVLCSTCIGRCDNMQTARVRLADVRAQMAALEPVARATEEHKAARAALRQRSDAAERAFAVRVSEIQSGSAVQLHEPAANELLSVRAALGAPHYRREAWIADALGDDEAVCTQYRNLRQAETSLVDTLADLRRRSPDAETVRDQILEIRRAQTAGTLRIAGITHRWQPKKPRATNHRASRNHTKEFR